MSILSSVFSPIGDIWNGMTGVSSQLNETYKQQQKAMDAQNNYNYAMWNLQNEYNSPTSQLARMREAGIDINPTSYALGTGNLSNVASNVSSANGFSGSGSPAGNPISALMGVASGIQSVRESLARKDNLETENSIKEHNLQWARDHNLPVGSVPGVDQTIASVANKGLKYGEKIKNTFIDKFNKSVARRKKWAEDNKDKSFWWKFKAQLPWN